MAVFRVEKNSGYTVMSNHHLRNRALSLKAKGLLSQMLSLPEDWDYTLQGLARINRESIDAIRQAIRERVEPPAAAGKEFSWVGTPFGQVLGGRPQSGCAMSCATRDA